MNPARSKSPWLATSTPEGASRKVEPKSVLIRMADRFQATGLPGGRTCLPANLRFSPDDQTQLLLSTEDVPNQIKLLHNNLKPKLPDTASCRSGRGQPGWPSSRPAPSASGPVCL